MMSKFLFVACCACSIVVGCKNYQKRSCIDEFVSRELPAKVINSNPKIFIKNNDQKTTLESLTRVDSLGELYYMDYTADYGLKEILAAGGVKSNNELLGYVQKHLLNIPATAMSLAHESGCSSFLVQAEDGHFLFCRNFDYVFASPVNVITRTKGTIGTFSMNMAIKSAKTGSADDGKSDNSFYVAAPLAIMDGMNEHGVAISVLVVKSYGAEQHIEGKDNITTTAVMREILDNARNVEEALAIFDSHNFFAHGGTWQSNYHFFLADATGRSVVVEYVNSGRDNQDDKNYDKVVTESRFTTNNFMWQPFRMPLSDKWREALIESHINDIKGKADAFRLLHDLSQIHDPDQGKSFKPGDAVGPDAFPETLWSVVYDLTERIAYYTTFHESEKGMAPFAVPMAILR